jgi:hypothetical protein
MTAEISILNKTAIVLAGDSAVTIGDGRKVYNTANKIFKLTNKGTVGIMIYNQANWMNIPLETIIKTYNNSIGETAYATLEEYRESFIYYLKTSIYKYVTSKSQDEIVKFKCFENLQLLAEIAVDMLQDDINSGSITKPVDEAEEVKEISKRISSFIIFLNTENKKQKQTLEEFKNYKFTDFKTKFSGDIKTIVEGFSKDQNLTLDKTFLSNFISLIYFDITQKISSHEDYTGVVIAGFGEDEIFPKILDFKLAELFENRLRIEFGKTGEIDNNTAAIIRPYAQRDMVDTFFQGIEPNLLRKLYSILDNEFEKLIKKLSTDYTIDEAKLKPEFEKTHTQIRRKLFEHRDKKHVDPIVTTVSYLNKEGLIELAESLVNITSLKRKTSSEVETVGGPVDIALITKGDGFKWIKNKDISL